MDLSGGAGGGISISKWRPPKHIRFTFPRGNLALLSRLSVKTKRDEDERSGASPLLHRTPRRVITACWPVSVSVSVGPHEGAVAASHFQGEESRRAHHFMSYVHVRSRSTCLRNACFDSTKLRSLVPPPRDVVKMAHGRAVHGDMDGEIEKWQNQGERENIVEIVCVCSLCSTKSGRNGVLVLLHTNTTRLFPIEESSKMHHAWYFNAL